MNKEDVNQIVNGILNGMESSDEIDINSHEVSEVRIWIEGFGEGIKLFMNNTMVRTVSLPKKEREWMMIVSLKKKRIDDKGLWIVLRLWADKKGDPIQYVTHRYNGNDISYTLGHYFCVSDFGEEAFDKALVDFNKRVDELMGMYGKEES